MIFKSKVLLLYSRMTQFNKHLKNKYYQLGTRRCSNCDKSVKHYDNGDNKLTETNVY